MKLAMPSLKTRAKWALRDAKADFDNDPLLKEHGKSFQLHPIPRLKVYRNHFDFAIRSEEETPQHQDVIDRIREILHRNFGKHGIKFDKKDEGILRVTDDRTFNVKSLFESALSNGGVNPTRAALAKAGLLHPNHPHSWPCYIMLLDEWK